MSHAAFAKKLQAGWGTRIEIVERGPLGPEVK